MNLLLRMFATLVRSCFRPRCKVDSPSAMDFVIWPWEAEWKVISHASLLTILDVARQDHMQRAGFLRLLFRNRWFLPVASVHVSFKRPMMRFHRITVTTRIPFWNEKDILIEHEVFRNGKLMATSIVRGMVKKGRETVDPRSIVAELGGGAVDAAAELRLKKLVEVELASSPSGAS